MRTRFLSRLFFTRGVRSRPLPPIVAYALSIAFDRAFSILTVPLMAFYVTPGHYGNYEVLLGLTALLSALMMLGINETAMRFIATETDPDARRRLAAEFLGTTIVVALVLGAIIQLFATILVDALAIQFDMMAIRLTFVSLSLGAIIELTLVWLRILDRGQFYFWTVTIRTISHVAATWLALLLGLGVDGVVEFNAIVAIAIAAFLGIILGRETGLALSRRALGQLSVYGAPIVLGSLAVVAIGPLNRLFLNGVATDSEIGVFGLAARLALAAGLAAQPFIMWWFPKRLAVLQTPSGHAENVRMWGYGVALTLLNGLGILLLAPIFIEYVLPVSYSAATEYLPGCVLMVVLAQIALMTSVGAMSRANGMSNLAIDLVGAAVAIVGLLLLPRYFGVWGAIAAGIASQLVRLGLHALTHVDGVRLAYPLGPVVFAGIVAAAACAIAPEALLTRIAWSVGALLAVAALVHILKIAELSPSAMRRLLQAGASERTSQDGR